MVVLWSYYGCMVSRWMHVMIQQRKPERMSDYDSEDDKPLVFKQNNATLKQTQANPEITKSVSQKHDAISGRQAFDVCPNGQNSSQVDNTVSLSVQSSFASQEASSSSAKAERKKQPATNMKAQTSTTDHSNYIEQQNVSNVVIEKTLGEEGQSREDSDDEKPLSHKLLFGDTNANSHHIRMESNRSCPSPCTPPKPRIDKDPEDEMVLSMKFSSMLNAGTSTGKSSDTDESKPLASELKKETSASLNKRPLIQTKNSVPTSNKKAKLSEASASANNKQKQPKAKEAHDDDVDDLPISQRSNKSGTPVSKVSDRKKRTDVSASLEKVNKKSKKVIKKTKFSGSLEVPPGSGEGQKWTTLVHNGVIFPPLYKPHGVKMLYKGKPVDLTPEQEEVSLSISFQSVSDAYLQF